MVFQEGQLEANREAIILSLSPAEGEEGAVIAGIDSATVIVLDSDGKYVHMSVSTGSIGTVLYWGDW